MSRLRVMAVVRSRFEATHCWPGAPDGPEAHLRNEHRHEFHVEVRIEQSHDDRDIEYLALKRELHGLLPSGPQGHLSCEMMARRLLEQLTELYGERAMRVEISEDGENGAIVATD